MATFDPKADYPFLCPHCGNKYKYRRNLLQHAKYECGKEPQNFCSLCSYKSKHRFQLYKHLRTVHKLNFVTQRRKD